MGNQQGQLIDYVYRDLLAIQDTVVYDDEPTLADAIRRLNSAATRVTGLLETLHATMQGKEPHS
jgi:hypothetical protein